MEDQKAAMLKEIKEVQDEVLQILEKVILMPIGLYEKMFTQCPQLKEKVKDLLRKLSIQLELTKRMISRYKKYIQGINLKPYRFTLENLKYITGALSAALLLSCAAYGKITFLARIGSRVTLGVAGVVCGGITIALFTLEIIKARKEGKEKEEKLQDVVNRLEKELNRAQQLM